MRPAQHARARIALVLSTMALGGCVVGTGYVSAPPRLPSNILPELRQTLSFDVCLAPDPTLTPMREEGARRAAWGERVKRSLSRVGVSAELTAAPGSPADFTVTLRDDLGPMWSFVVSLVTLSIVPGYATQRQTLEVDVAWLDAAQAEKTEHLRYQSRTHLFIWFPLVVSQDFILAVSDGWESPKLEDGGFRQMVERLGDDLRARMGRGGAEASRLGMPAMACPALVGR
jgi:hypothetical protein